MAMIPMAVVPVVVTMPVVDLSDHGLWYGHVKAGGQRGSRGADGGQGSQTAKRGGGD